MGGVCLLRRGDNPFPKNADGTVRYDLIHYKETWKALEALVAKGLVKALGLSNFSSRQIDDVLSVASVRPAVLQVSTTNRPMEDVLCVQSRKNQVGNLLNGGGKLLEVLLKEFSV